MWEQYKNKPTAAVAFIDFMQDLMFMEHILNSKEFKLWQELNKDHLLICRKLQPLPRNISVPHSEAGKLMDWSPSVMNGYFVDLTTVMHTALFFFFFFLLLYHHQL